MIRRQEHCIRFMARGMAYDSLPEALREAIND